MYKNRKNRKQLSHLFLLFQFPQRGYGGEGGNYQGTRGRTRVSTCTLMPLFTLFIYTPPPHSRYHRPAIVLISPVVTPYSPYSAQTTTMLLLAMISVSRTHINDYYCQFIHGTRLLYVQRDSISEMADSLSSFRRIRSSLYYMYPSALELIQAQQTPLHEDSFLTCRLLSAFCVITYFVFSICSFDVDDRKMNTV